MKKISILGTGYVGLVTGTCFADVGNLVKCVDINPKIVEKLKQGKSHIYEPGLEELIQKNMSKGRLSFTTNTKQAINDTDIVFICLPTPCTEDGHCNTSYIMNAAKSIGESIDKYKIIVNKSTVPAGTARKLEDEIKKYTNVPFAIASNPEFLKEGTAVKDFMWPDRVVIGTDDSLAGEILSELYDPFTLTKKPKLVMDPESAETVKCASNAFLATKISFINEVAQYCEKVGADVKNVAKGMGADSRIGSDFLHAGPGYGGSCFPKDTQALIADARDRGINLQITEAAESVNHDHKIYSAEKIIATLNGVFGKQIGIWGLAFKGNTDDMREAPSLTILPILLENGAILHAHDPQSIENAKKIFGNKINYCNEMYDVCKGSDALVILTDWNEYKNPDFDLVKSSLRNLFIVDLRNLYYTKRNELSKQFKYVGMGTK